MNVKGMNAVRVVNEAPFFRGPDFDSGVNFTLLVQFTVNQVFESVDDSLATRLHRERYGTVRDNLAGAYQWIFAGRKGSFSGMAMRLGAPETSNAATSISGVDIISPIASLRKFGERGICASA